MIRQFSFSQQSFSFYFLILFITPFLLLFKKKWRLYILNDVSLFQIQTIVRLGYVKTMEHVMILSTALTVRVPLVSLERLVMTVSSVALCIKRLSLTRDLCVTLLKLQYQQNLVQQHFIASCVFLIQLQMIMRRIRSSMFDRFF